MSDRNQSILVSGGHKGTEAEFGRCAEKWGVRQVTLSYEGHVMEYSKDVEVLSADELPGTGRLGQLATAAGRHFRRLDAGRQHLKGLSKQGISRQDCRRFAVFGVATGLAATHVVVVHRWQIVVNQRVGVYHFDRTGRRQGSLMVVTASLASH